MTLTNPKSEIRITLPRNPAVWLVVGAAVLLLIILLIMAVSRPAAPTIASLTSAPSAAASTASSPTQTTADPAEAEHRAVARAQLLRFQQDAEDARRALADCDQELAVWEKEVGTELTGKRGRAVAADNESLQRFCAVYAHWGPCRGIPRMRPSIPRQVHARTAPSDRRRRRCCFPKMNRTRTARWR